MNAKVLFFSLMLLTLLACEKEDFNTGGSSQAIEIPNLEGQVEKGPYLLGSSISLLDWDTDLQATGRTFTTQTTSNEGNFNFSNLNLSGRIVEMKATGFYFNEVSGENSSAQLTLIGLLNLDGEGKVGINVLTHLERFRILQLLNEGQVFSVARAQAKIELMRLFSFDPNLAGGVDFERLSIVQEGEANAILLAASVILQGRRTVADLSELLAKIGADFGADGVLDDVSLGNALLSDVKFMDLSLVRRQLEDRYPSFGGNFVIPPFEKYIESFIENTSFEFVSGFSYPGEGAYGPNILASNGDTIRFDGGQQGFSLAANVPNGSKLRIRLVQEVGLWGYGLGTNAGWDVSPYDASKREQWFTSNRTGEMLDVFLSLPLSGRARLEYFENTTDVPTQTKILTWGVLGNAFQQGQFGPNLLALDSGTEIDPGDYSIEVIQNDPDTGPLPYAVGVRVTPKENIALGLDQIINWEIQMATSDTAFVDFTLLLPPDKNSAALPLTLQEGGGTLNFFILDLETGAPIEERSIKW